MGRSVGNRVESVDMPYVLCVYMIVSYVCQLCFVWGAAPCGQCYASVQHPLSRAARCGG